MSAHVDVVVVGAGIAGCAAATALAHRGARVAIVHTTVHSWHPDEAITPATALRLGALFGNDVRMLLHDARPAPIARAWTTPGSPSHDGEIVQRLDRDALNTAARRATRACGVQFFGATTPPRLTRTRRGWRVAHGARSPVSAPQLVLATGRVPRTTLRTLACRRVVVDRLVAICVAFTAPPLPWLDHSFAIECFDGGYCYALPTNETHSVVVAVTDADLVRRYGATAIAAWRSMIARCPSIAPRIEGARPLRSRSVCASSSYLVPAAAHDWVAVGDALVSHDPIYGAGVEHAVYTGMLASTAVDEGATFVERYVRETRSSFMHYLERRSELYLDANRWQDAPFWLRRSGLAHAPTLTLDPDETLLRNLSSRREGSWRHKVEGLLPYRIVDALLRRVEVPRRVGELANWLREACPYTPDNDVVASLELLEHEGVVRRVRDR